MDNNRGVMIAAAAAAVGLGFYFISRGAADRGTNATEPVIEYVPTTEGVASEIWGQDEGSAYVSPEMLQSALDELRDEVYNRMGYGQYIPYDGVNY